MPFLYPLLLVLALLFPPPLVVLSFPHLVAMFFQLYLVALILPQTLVPFIFPPQLVAAPLQQEVASLHHLPPFLLLHLFAQQVTKPEVVFSMA